MRAQGPWQWAHWNRPALPAVVKLPRIWRWVGWSEPRPWAVPVGARARREILGGVVGLVVPGALAERIQMECAGRPVGRCGHLALIRPRGSPRPNRARQARSRPHRPDCWSCLIRHHKNNKSKKVRSRCCVVRACVRVRVCVRACVLHG